MRVMLVQEDLPYDNELEVVLMGWLMVDGRPMAVVATEEFDSPWMVHMSRILYLKQA